MRHGDTSKQTVKKGRRPVSSGQGKSGGSERGRNEQKRSTGDKRRTPSRGARGGKSRSSAK